ncbi:MAG: hypothetical protein AAF772_19915 [Acidobacteriota bacterium]
MTQERTPYRYAAKLLHQWTTPALESPRPMRSCVENIYDLGTCPTAEGAIDLAHQRGREVEFTATHATGAEMPYRYVGVLGLARFTQARPANLVWHALRYVSRPLENRRRHTTPFEKLDAVDWDRRRLTPAQLNHPEDLEVRTFGVEMLFQWRTTTPDGRSNTMRPCQTQIVHVDSRTARDAYRQALAHADAQTYTIDGPNKDVRFECVGIVDMIEIDPLDDDSDEVWYDVRKRLMPMERKDAILPARDRLLAARQLDAVPLGIQRAIARAGLRR